LHLCCIYVIFLYFLNINDRKRVENLIDTGSAQIARKHCPKRERELEKQAYRWSLLMLKKPVFYRTFQQNMCTVTSNFFTITRIDSLTSTCSAEKFYRKLAFLTSTMTIYMPVSQALSLSWGNACVQFERYPCLLNFLPSFCHLYWENTKILHKYSINAKKKLNYMSYWYWISEKVS
jgi:hypothetical protein